VALTNSPSKFEKGVKAVIRRAMIAVQPTKRQIDATLVRGLGSRGLSPPFELAFTARCV
jgi:hypothetical protein